MATTAELDNGDSARAAAVDTQPLALRSYQAEMVEESLKSNIIVVMDTGSGKTHIAVERTRAELEICNPSKRVWFLAPTIALCEQQSKVFEHHLPSYNILMLSGQDDVDHWTEQRVWDSVLYNVRIVLSTHQVLYDALAHAFVRMDELALLIFDEAHHCTLNHPANRIMSSFYIPRIQQADEDLPKVLGLSASPVMKAQATMQSLQKIECNMHATAKTPKRYRSELAQYVHQPELIRMNYRLETAQANHSPLLGALSRNYTEYDLTQDPYTRDLIQKQQCGVDVTKQLQKLFLRQKTNCLEQLKSLTHKSQDMIQELGLPAAEWYLHRCMETFEKSVSNAKQLLDGSNDEKQHLLTIMRQLPFQVPLSLPPFDMDHLSPKVNDLIDVLVSEAQNNPTFTGLVFVEQRIWVAVLAEILTVHPRTKHLFRVGTFLGSSSSSKRKAMVSAFAEPKNQQSTLENFRAGTTNLILATSVLEEGIDVSSCHLVVCFERPKNLKSFVQRRGRARMQKSKYFIFMPEVGGEASPATWEALEHEMKKNYLDDMRQSKLGADREAEEEEGARCFTVEATGARLTLADAVPHLNHFCALLASGPYVDPRPLFEFFWSESGNSVTAEVTLPTSVDIAVRKARSLEAWRTEKMATKDAAFEAYKGLYFAGLINSNLLPVRQESQDMASEFQVPDYRPSMVPVSPTLDPWLMIAQQHQRQSNVYFRTLLEIQTGGENSLFINLFTVAPVPTVGKIELFWNESQIYTATMSRTTKVRVSEAELLLLRSVTRKILLSVHSARMQDSKEDLLWLLAPCDNTGQDLNFTKLAQWARDVDEYHPALSLLANAPEQSSQWGLITQHGDNRKYLLQAVLDPRKDATDEASSEAYLQVIRMPKRRDFLHRVANTGNTNEAYTRVETLRSSECMVDSLPVSYSIIALLIPSIMHKTEVAMIADNLRTTLLAPVDIEIEDLPLVVRALTASSTHGEDNYQRLEFLGDCILKLISSLHVMAENSRWPESYLTGKKGKIVSNSFLARASLAAGLDKFIITKSFTGMKWSPRYWTDLLTTTTSAGKQEKSSKLLADVIESLIGVGYVLGGLSNGFACVQTLLPLEKWTSLPEANATLYHACPTDLPITNLGLLESLIGYTFTKKVLLLEALTHASYTGPNVSSSYERLEFLGDAVLDYIISKRLYAREPPLSHQKMHAMKTAMANAAFLAFCMLETTISEQTISKSTLQVDVHERALWQFLRTGSPQMTAVRNEMLQQHTRVREQLLHALEHDDEFPWHLLALNNAPKFLSDIVESVIGAIYVDSQGDFTACEVFVHRLGILDCLERILQDNVDCLHPKERLGHLAGNRKVQYAPIHNTDPNMIDSPADMAKIWRCQVKVGGENVGGVVEGMTRLNAETIAAWQANKNLRGEVFVAVESSEEHDDFFDAEEGGGVALGDC
ncbi:hypothetical protein OPT61_g2638 [Boeremia exigua]|uniref:Uncharacterized protein n=1 Tax=Boeremia exigua TaxID=749465 RepID=A0ACC2IKY1_9PLEO|nr:hypothetical protein OPT61_g2638 [Boeremia exigua]